MTTDRHASLGITADRAGCWLQVVREYDVRAFPTIMAFQHGVPIGKPYDGLRDAEDMAQWVRDTIASPPAPTEREKDDKEEAKLEEKEARERVERKREDRKAMPQRVPTGTRPQPSSSGDKQEKPSMEDINRIAEAFARDRKKRAPKAARDEREGGEDDPDGLDEGWFPFGKGPTRFFTSPTPRESTARHSARPSTS